MWANDNLLAPPGTFLAIPWLRASPTDTPSYHTIMMIIMMIIIIMITMIMIIRYVSNSETPS